MRLHWKVEALRDVTCLAWLRHPSCAAAERVSSCGRHLFSVRQPLLACRLTSADPAPHRLCRLERSSFRSGRIPGASRIDLCAWRAYGVPAVLAVVLAGRLPALAMPFLGSSPTLRVPSTCDPHWQLHCSAAPHAGSTHMWTPSRGVPSCARVALHR